MQISQLQVSHDGMQDRLMLRIATSAKEEIRAWITRRFLRELWVPLVSVMLDHLSTPPVASDAHAPAGNPGAPAGNFDEPFRDDNRNYPLGKNPLLVSEVQMEPTAPNVVRMTLREARERSFSMNLNADLMQALCSMLRATSEQAGWELALDYSTPSAAAPRPTPTERQTELLDDLPPVKGPGKSRLH